MAQVKFIATVKNKINDIPVESGQVIFSTDDRVIYLDSKDKRVSFQQIMDLETETERENYQYPLDGCFYYVNDTNLLYRYTKTKQ